MPRPVWDCGTRWLWGAHWEGNGGENGHVKDGDGRLCVQTLSWKEKGIFLAQNQAAVALLQRWSRSTNQAARRVSSKAALLDLE